ncbi:Histone-lysine N-methyltransferase, H3 lysine-79 specific [Mycena sanguinolenta]|uniref:Histone-lysine N-methyltransferase, H3 lysine-79 specific n=1 Tax=Mycena sanguinolenta TaxID=230812 RepID=A0A8H6WUF9_9AGAR|nr:Histone-lysine N-methyltransferase, H3 lysine-79 specific [Mycena sanguinolenta]
MSLLRASSSCPNPPNPWKRPNPNADLISNAQWFQPKKLKTSGFFGLAQYLDTTPLEPDFHHDYFLGEDGSAHSAQSSQATVLRELSSYSAYFRNKNNPDDTSFDCHLLNYPFVQVEYPNTDAFVLLEPVYESHYNPIAHLESVLKTIITCFLNPSQRARIGPMPGTPDHVLGEDCPELVYVRRAIFAPDGPAFFKAVTDINTILRDIKYPWPPDTLGNPLKQVFLMRPGSGGVGHSAAQLSEAKPWSDKVYGELLPPLVHGILRRTKLRENSLFIDLGSGIGNVVVQASLQAGCRAYGIELDATRARIAKEMVTNLRTRCLLWGLKIGDIELEEGDMLQSARVTELIPLADVVLINNEIFSSQLNENLRLKLVHLKEGAIVISLECFRASCFSKRNAWLVLLRGAFGHESNL